MLKSQKMPDLDGKLKLSFSALDQNWKTGKILQT
jgi:hypothetical protein